MTMIKDCLSVVIPCYRSEKNIEQVIKNAQNAFSKSGITKYEFILVNDCSPDNTLVVLENLAKSFQNITVINLAKNSGQHGALMAGFRHVSGEYVVTCEDDGQTQIEMIGEMMARLQEGYDVVAAKYMQRSQKSPFRRLGTAVATKMAITMMPRPKGVSVPIFFLAKRFVIDEMTKYEQPYPYVTGLLLRTTHNIANIPVEQLERMSGSSGYGFGKLIKLWMNGFTAFSIKPLRMATYMGFFSAVIGVLYAIFIIFRRFLFQDIIAGWSSLIAITLIMFGITLCVLGMIGEYVGRIYMCINNTPQYVIKNIILGNLEEQKNEEKDCDIWNN